MATLKQRLCKRNADNTYDAIHLETSADIVRMPTGGTVEEAINGKAAINHAHIEYASASHKHAAADITSGILPVAHGGTGVASLDELKSSLGITGGPSIIKTYSNLHQGDTVTVDGKHWIVFFIDPIEKTVYLGLRNCATQMVFHSGGSISSGWYAGTDLAIYVEQWKDSNISESLLQHCKDITISYYASNSTRYYTNKVTIPSADMLYGFGFLPNLETYWWTSSGNWSMNNVTNAFVVRRSGTNAGVVLAVATTVAGVRPFIALDIS